MVAATPEAKLRPGVTVAIHGLKGAADLNGKEGTVDKWDADKGRWNVKMSGGEVKALKPENLQPKGESAPIPPWAIGAIGLVVVAAVLFQQSDIFGGASPAGYVKSLFEPFDPPPPQAPKDTVVISFCQG